MPTVFFPSDLFPLFLNLLLLTPLVLLVRALLPHALAVRSASTAIGVYALFAVAPRFVIFFLGYWVCIWLLQFLMRLADRLSIRVVAIAFTASGLLVALTPLLAWKAAPQSFTPWITVVAAHWFWAMFPQLGYVDTLVGIIEPIGLSFTVFRALDLLIKVRLELLPRLTLGRTLFYGLFAPVLVGPIAEYEDVQLEKRLSRLPNPGDLAVGGFRFALGCVKIFLLAYAFERLSAYFWQGGTGTTAQIWAALLAFGAYFYLNFSGYSDLAIGVARMYGFKLKENFNNPFFRTNPQAFWNNWHMSLTRWVQRYVFVPLGGMRPQRQYFAIFMTIMAIALWHGIGWPQVIFGTYHGLIMVGYRWLEQHRPKDRKVRNEPWWRALKMVAVFSYVSLSIPLLILPIGEVWNFYKLLIPGVH